MERRETVAKAVRWSGLVLLLVLISMPAVGAPKGRPVTDAALAHLSQSAVTRFYLANPDRAPAGLAERLASLNTAAPTRGSAPNPSGFPIVADRFNFDFLGLPQNEESVSVCRADQSFVIGGTNDFRGLLDPEGNFTGWHFSQDGGFTLANEGLLPPVTTGGDTRPSGGDPVFKFSRTDPECNIYAGSLNYDPVDPFANTNGIGIYRTDPATLNSPACGDDGPSDPDCWPTARYASFSADPTHFFDKEWFDVGNTGDGEHVWVTWSDFDMTPTPENPAGFTAEIFAARCEADLSACTAPIPISADDIDVQFSDVTIGPDGRTYVTWAQIAGELEGTAQTFTFKMRVAEPGATAFGPERVIFAETNAIPFGGFLHANDFRVATYPKNEVKMVAGNPRVYVVWDACKFRVLDTVCEEPDIWLTYSDNMGVTWSPRKKLSEPGDNYFPTIANDPTGNRLAVAWFTNRFDGFFHNAQDVELATIDRNGVVKNLQLITFDVPSNQTGSDPLLGAFFIGDYIEVDAYAHEAWVHFNANYKRLKLLGEGTGVPQQDNYLRTAIL
jgi:hypothetical protein